MPVREIVDHYDGHGLAESIIITCDDISPAHGGASHHYTAKMSGSNRIVADVQFQKGPRNELGSIAGCIDAVLLAIVVDRMRCFNAGQFTTRENALVMTHCQEAIHWLKARADERALRGVLGHNVK